MVSPSVIECISATKRLNLRRPGPSGRFFGKNQANQGIVENPGVSHLFDITVSFI
jgi:hypothetical protein